MAPSLNKALSQQFPTVYFRTCPTWFNSGNTGWLNKNRSPGVMMFRLILVFKAECYVNVRSPFWPSRLWLVCWSLTMFIRYRRQRPRLWLWRLTFTTCSRPPLCTRNWAYVIRNNFYFTYIHHKTHIGTSFTFLHLKDCVQLQYLIWGLTMTATNHDNQLVEIYQTTLNQLNCTFGVSFSRFHCCGCHGHGLRRSWFVDIMVVAVMVCGRYVAPWYTA